MASIVSAANSHGRALHTRTASASALTGWGRRALAVPAHRVRSPRARGSSSEPAPSARPGCPGWTRLLTSTARRLPGDFGFDPLGLGEEPSALKWYVQAELVHCRFAMAGVAGILFTDVRIRDLPVWFEAGAAKFDFANTTSLFFVQLLLMGFAETKRYMDFKNPGSQAEEGTFIGLEAALVGLQPGYPGGPLFNPLGLAKDIENAHEEKLKEIKNGRLAMVAMLGFIVQASVTHVGPIDNLLTHLSDPFNKNIIHAF
ncbi:chlorophyll a-b binding protein 4, chloroplastic [Panicum miliaceum]|uniref:Chlorophyll a-b binding protein, chloroplastic n=1 Tax=Panicum miliaceum TaxID=4540 RepID=A0A3L6RV13_PANMI|nr:chlorophyll a-b binding protein 4, chloroplastic [Panicum miliaceum]